MRALGFIKVFHPDSTEYYLRPSTREVWRLFGIGFSSAPPYPLLCRLSSYIRLCLCVKILHRLNSASGEVRQAESETVTQFLATGPSAFAILAPAPALLPRTPDRSELQGLQRRVASRAGAARTLPGSAVNVAWKDQGSCAAFDVESPAIWSSPSLRFQSSEPRMLPPAQAGLQRPAPEDHTSSRSTGRLRSEPDRQTSADARNRAPAQKQVVRIAFFSGGVTREDWAVSRRGHRATQEFFYIHFSSMNSVAAIQKLGCVGRSPCVPKIFAGTNNAIPENLFQNRFAITRRFNELFAIDEHRGQSQAVQGRVFWQRMKAAATAAPTSSASER